MSKPTVEELRAELEQAIDALAEGVACATSATKTSSRESAIRACESAEQRILALFTRALEPERPRPVVRENVGGHEYATFDLIGITLGTLEPLNGDWLATCHVDNDERHSTRDDCRAWLIAKLREAGFTVETEGT